MQKQCCACGLTKPRTEFHVRAASADGLNARCKVCWNSYKATRYAEIDGAETRARTTRNKRDRIARDPVYKRAFNLWLSTKKRTKIPPWVAMSDFFPVCRTAVDFGDGWQIDHVIPLKGKTVCGLHVPQNVRVLPKETNVAKAWTENIPAAERWG